MYVRICVMLLHSLYIVVASWKKQSTMYRYQGPKTKKFQLIATNRAVDCVAVFIFTPSRTSFIDNELFHLQCSHTVCSQ